MKRLIISEVLKTPKAITNEKGEYIKKVILENIHNNEVTTLDFSGIESLTTAFLNKSIGELYCELDNSSDVLNSLVKFDVSTISNFQKLKIKEVLRNSKNKSIEHEKMIDEITIYG